MIRMLLVDVDPVRRAWLKAALEKSGLRVVGQADSGAEALAEAARCTPQVALVAYRLPDLTGAEATRRLLERHPVPVVLFLEPADLEGCAAEEARECGATCWVEVPPAPGAGDHAARLADLARTLHLMHEVPVVQRRRSRTPARGPGRPLPALIALAASTGGPAAVQAVLQGLPRDFPVPLVLVQHLSDGFAEALIEWLRRSLSLSVVAAADGEIPQPGTLYVAAGQQHLVVRPGPVLGLVRGAPVQGHKPSANVLFQSLARTLGPKGVGVILTGMGEDGADGLLELRRAGGVTYAQDEASCVVYGMPREAVRRGGVLLSMTLPELGSALCSLAGIEPAGTSSPGPKEVDP